ncbi:MAG: RNA polymerase sigma factor RpoD/SigA, partial [Calditrichia bacterium]
MARQDRSPRSRYRHSLEKYLDDISEIPLIDTREEIELARRIRQGDQNALEKLIKSNLRFVVKIAKEYQHQGLPLTDLINEGNLGLIKAAKRFDETRGFKFISYGVWWIRQSILKALAEHSRVVRLPLNRLGTISKVNQIMKDLEQKFNREPTCQEISKKLDIPVSDITQALMNSMFHLSLDQPIRR